MLVSGPGVMAILGLPGEEVFCAGVWTWGDGYSGDRCGAPVQLSPRQAQPGFAGQIYKLLVERQDTCCPFLFAWGGSTSRDGQGCTVPLEP